MTTASFLEELQALVTAGRVTLQRVPHSDLIRDEHGECPVVAVAVAKAGGVKRFTGPSAAGDYLHLGLNLFDIKDGSDFPAHLCNQRAKLVRECLERLAT